MYPDIKQEDYQIYDFFLKRGLYNAIDKNREGFLLACDNIPCGIMANTPGKSSYYVNYICTWPVRPNQKAPFGAQTLFLHIFNNLLQKGINYIELNATRFGNAVTKYRRLGFKSYGGDNYTEVMKINKERMKNSIDILKGKIDLQLACNNEEFDLFKILKPNTLY